MDACDGINEQQQQERFEKRFEYVVKFFESYYPKEMGKDWRGIFIADSIAEVFTGILSWE